MLDFRTLWDRALPYPEFLAASTKHKGLWEGIYAIARLPAWATGALVPGARRRLLVLAEDWCGDASSTAVMDQYLTNGSRSIPIVIALDQDYRELGHWGPRPRELQAWVMANRGTVPKAELYPKIRQWYARDHGESTVREVLETAGVEVPAAVSPTRSDAGSQGMDRASGE
jgi:hypothetical protein